MVFICPNSYTVNIRPSFRISFSIKSFYNVDCILQLSAKSPRKNVRFLFSTVKHLKSLTVFNRPVQFGLSIPAWQLCYFMMGIDCLSVSLIICCYFSSRFIQGPFSNKAFLQPGLISWAFCPDTSIILERKFGQT